MQTDIAWAHAHMQDSISKLEVKDPPIPPKAQKNKQTQKKHLILKD